MSKSLSIPTLAVAILFAAGNAAYAGFAGQIILGPLGPGSSVNGNTTGHGDENDGWTSGEHIFDLWNGPDDVWQLNWPGGSMELEMLYNNAAGDLDLFLYEPGSYSDSGNYSILSTGVEHISEPGAAAGIYYIVVDGYDGGAGAYTLNVTPEPSTIALLSMGFLVFVRRSRRQA